MWPWPLAQPTGLLMVMECLEMNKQKTRKKTHPGLWSLDGWKACWWENFCLQRRASARWSDGLHQLTIDTRVTKGVGWAWLRTPFHPHSHPQVRCMLNIWGVMLFIRLSWIVGEAGIGEQFPLLNDFYANCKLNNKLGSLSKLQKIKVTEDIYTWPDNARKERWNTNSWETGIFQFAQQGNGQASISPFL